MNPPITYTRDAAIRSARTGATPEQIHSLCDAHETLAKSIREMRAIEGLMYGGEVEDLIEAAGVAQGEIREALVIHRLHAEGFGLRPDAEGETLLEGLADDVYYLHKANPSLLDCVKDAIKARIKRNGGFLVGAN